MPTRSTTPRTNRAPSRYCRSLASRPSSRRSTWSTRSAPLRRRWNFARIVGDRRDHRGADPVHHEVGVPLEQRHHRGEPVEDLALRRGLHASTSEPPLAARGSKPRGPRRRPPQPRLSRSRQRRRVEVGRVDERAQLAHQVVAQPRHRGELHPVGLLVQAHPEPEVARVDVQLPLGLHDVGRDEQQPAGRVAASAPYGGKSSYWPSTLVARNASSDPVSTPVTLRADRVAAPARSSAAAPASFSTSGSSTVRKPAALAWIQPGRSMTTTEAPGASSAARPAR